MVFTLQTFSEDTLASDITDNATSMTLTTGNFGTPTGEQMLVIDPDVTSKREIIKCAIDGTAVTSIDRAQDGTSAVAHSSGAKVIMAFVKSHHEALKDGTGLADNAIIARHLSTASVETAKIKDDAVTSAKLDPATNTKVYEYKYTGGSIYTAANTYQTVCDEDIVLTVPSNITVLFSGSAQNNTANLQTRVVCLTIAGTTVADISAGFPASFQYFKQNMSIIGTATNVAAGTQTIAVKQLSETSVDGGFPSNAHLQMTIIVTPYLA